MAFGSVGSDFPSEWGHSPDPGLRTGGGWGRPRTRDAPNLVGCGQVAPRKPGAVGKGWAHRMTESSVENFKQMLGVRRCRLLGLESDLTGFVVSSRNVGLVVFYRIRRNQPSDFPPARVFCRVGTPTPSLPTGSPQARLNPPAAVPYLSRRASDFDNEERIRHVEGEDLGRSCQRTGRPDPGAGEQPSRGQDQGCLSHRTCQLRPADPADLRGQLPGLPPAGQGWGRLRDDGLRPADQGW